VEVTEKSSDVTLGEESESPPKNVTMPERGKDSTNRRELGSLQIGKGKQANEKLDAGR